MPRAASSSSPAETAWKAERAAAGLEPMELGVHRGPPGAVTGGKGSAEALEAGFPVGRKRKWLPLWASAPGQVPLQAAPRPREGRLLARPTGELGSGPDSSSQALD